MQAGGVQYRIMEPRIQYAKTGDGVSIAWATMGAGQPILLMPSQPWSWMAGWDPFIAATWAPLAEEHRLVVYDSRGTGFSDRDALDFSMGAMIRDLEAVVAQVGGEPFALVAITNAAPLAVTYANHL